MATHQRTCATHRPDWNSRADRLLTARSEQSDARERRSRADLKLTINRRRPVIGDVLDLKFHHGHTNAEGVQQHSPGQANASETSVSAALGIGAALWFGRARDLLLVGPIAEAEMGPTMHYSDPV